MVILLLCTHHLIQLGSGINPSHFKIDTVGRRLKTSEAYHKCSKHNINKEHDLWSVVQKNTCWRLVHSPILFCV